MAIDLNPWSPLISIGSKIVDRLIPDPAAKAQAQLELIKLQQEGEFKQLDADLQLALAQSEVNKVEAGSDDPFRAGWRPAVGWICAFGLAYQMVIRPLGGWAMLNVADWGSMPPPLELDTLMTLLFGMLGLGAFRTAEKIRGTK